MDDRQPCEVLVDGRWVPGTLLAWTRHDRSGRWVGVVRYTIDRWQQYQQARPTTGIRPA